MKTALIALFILTLTTLAGLTGCSDTRLAEIQPIADEFGIVFYDSSYPATGQPNCDEFGNWHAAPAHLTFTLKHTVGNGPIPPCDWEIRKGFPDPKSGGELFKVVAVVKSGQVPEYDFTPGTHWIGVCRAGTDQLIASVWLLVEDQ